jgi:hypothetical protein
MKNVPQNYLRLKSSYNPAKYVKVTPSKSYADNVHSFLSTSACKFPCIYLIQVHMFTENVYKYGYTNDLARRFNEHEKRYGRDISLTMHAHIPEYFLRDAENDIKDYFSSGEMKYPQENYNELVKLEDDHLQMVTRLYKLVSEKYNKSYETAINENVLLHKILKI